MRNSNKSVMSHDFGRIPQTEIQRSTFDRSHGVKTAFDSGFLVPFYVDEVLPGDTFKLTASMLARLSTPVVPIMDNIFLETQWFYCPSRLLYTNFTKLMGERVNPNDSIDYLIPQIDSGNGFAVGSLADYFGIPTGVKGLKVNALPFRMYAKVWDDWYRDENLQNSIIQTSDDLGDNSSVDFTKLLRRGKRRDYLTGCLPWPQKGEGVDLPIGGHAPVYGDGSMLLTQTPNGNAFGISASSNSGQVNLKNSDGMSQTLPSSGSSISTLTTGGLIGLATHDQSQENEQGTGIYADLGEASGVTINALRTAFQLQKLLEADARGGTRFVEILRNHFKTICPDARLQRSEYLGGSSQLVNISQVPQTSSSDSATPQGNLAAIGQVSDTVHIVKSFSEHGYIIGLVNVRCDLNYQQGLNRMWSRRGRYDFYWPVLAHLGEQAVLNKEIYAQGPDVKDSLGNVIDDQPFGYQERFAEYRYHPSVITGKLRSTAAQSLDVWHLAQKFDSLPLLDGDFIQDNPPLKRALAVQDEPEFIFDAYIKCICTRPMPTYSVPGLIDHF